MKRLKQRLEKYSETYIVILSFMPKIDEKIKSIKKEILINLLPLVLLLILLVAFYLLAWNLNTRSNYMVYVYAGTAVSTLILLAMSFIFIHNILPRKRYISLLKEAKYTNIYRNKIIFLKEIGDETFKGVSCVRFLAKEKDEDKDIEFLIEKSSMVFKENEIYSVFSHDGLIIGREEK